MLIRACPTARNENSGKLKAQRKEAAMRPSELLPQYRETIRQLVLQAGMANPRVFGSVLHGDDEDGSDLDLLVDPAPRTSLLDLAGLQIDIEAHMGVKVDLLTPKCLPLKFRQKVLDEALPI
jgi:predicted nucleotidyltransferase